MDPYRGLSAFRERRVLIAPPSPVPSPAPVRSPGPMPRPPVRSPAVVQYPAPLRPPLPSRPPGYWSASTRPRRAVYYPPLDRTAVASVTSRKSIYAPDEIWVQIVDELKVHDTRDPGLAMANTRALAALCRVNHQLERIVRPALWTDIHIRVHPWRRLIRLLESIMESPALAELISSIHLYVGTPVLRSLVHYDIIPRLRGLCNELRITEELRAKLLRACDMLFQRDPDSVDAVITLLAASAPSLKTLMFAPAVEEYRVPSELKPGQLLPRTTMLAEFIHQSAVLALLDLETDKRPLPLRHLKRVQIMNDVLDLSSHTRLHPLRTTSSLSQFCLGPEVKEFCGVGWNISQNLTNGSPLQLVEGQREKFFLHLMQPPGYRDIICHGLQVLTLTDCNTSHGALAYLLRLFPSLITLDITARPKGACDWSFIDFGEQLRGTAGKNLRSLRLREWETKPAWQRGQPHLFGPGQTILGRLDTLHSLAGLELPLEALIEFRARRLHSQPLAYLVDSLPTSLRVLSLYSTDLPYDRIDKLDRRVEALMAARDKFRHLCLIRLTTSCLTQSWVTCVAPDGWYMHARECEDADPMPKVHMGFSRDPPLSP